MEHMPFGVKSQDITTYVNHEAGSTSDMVSVQSSTSDTASAPALSLDDENTVATKGIDAVIKRILV